MVLYVVKKGYSLFCDIKRFSLLYFFIGDSHPADSSGGCDLVESDIVARSYFLHLEIVEVCKEHKFTAPGFDFIDKFHFICRTLSHLNQPVKELDAHCGKQLI